MVLTWKTPNKPAGEPATPKFTNPPPGALFVRGLQLSGLAIALSLGFSSCVAVKGYEMVNLNDPDMVLNPTGVEVQQVDFQSYREAAAGANGGKTGGGCGCN